MNGASILRVAPTGWLMLHLSEEVPYTRRLSHHTISLPCAQVISNGMQKSVLVAIDRLVRHKKYDRVLRRTTKLMVSVVFHSIGCMKLYLMIDIAVQFVSRHMTSGMNAMWATLFGSTSAVH